MVEIFPWSLHNQWNLDQSRDIVTYFTFLCLELTDPILIVDPSSTSNRNQSIFFYCSSNCTSLVEFSWYKDDVQIAHTEETFVIPNIDLASVGTYWCAVNDKFQRKFSNNIPIKVNCKFFFFVIRRSDTSLAQEMFCTCTANFVQVVSCCQIIYIKFAIDSLFKLKFYRLVFMFLLLKYSL